MSSVQSTAPVEGRHHDRLNEFAAGQSSYTKVVCDPELKMYNNYSSSFLILEDNGGDYVSGCPRAQNSARYLQEDHLLPLETSIMITFLSCYLYLEQAFTFPPNSAYFMGDAQLPLHTFKNEDEIIALILFP